MESGSIMNRRRVVITGMGVLCANGVNVAEFHKALSEGRSGIKEATLFDTSAYSFRGLGEIQNFAWPDASLDRASQLALAAAAEAVEDAGIHSVNRDRGRIGVVIGTTCGGVTSHERLVRASTDGRDADAVLLDEVSLHVMAKHIADRYELQGPVATIAIACASGANAVGYAADLIRCGQCDMMLAGGSDTVSNFTYSGFSSLRAMTQDLCRPFDRDRSGLVLGEGSGILVLEEAEHAKRRGARIYAEVLGYGFCNDGYHSTAPDPKGGGMARSIRRALQMAGMRAEDIDYVNAHGTGTRHNDVMECNAYRAVFNDRAKEIPISSTKSMIGHTLGAAGAIELIAAVVGLWHGFMPPTINHLTTDPECGLDVIPNQARTKRLRYVMSCNAGFAGNNAAVIAGKFG